MDLISDLAILVWKEKDAYRPIWIQLFDEFPTQNRNFSTFMHILEHPTFNYHAESIQLQIWDELYRETSLLVMFLWFYKFLFFGVRKFY